MSYKFTLLILISLFITGTFSLISAQPLQPPQPLPVGGKAAVELLINTGFETDTDANKLPDGWISTGTAIAKADKLKCNKPGAPVAHSGNCAFMFRGNPDGTVSSLAQPVSAFTALTEGAVLTFSAYLDPHSGTPDVAFGKVNLKLSDGNQLKLSLRIPSPDLRASAYVLVSDSLTLNLNGASVTKVKVKLLTHQTGGKFLIDDVSLTVADPIVTATATVTPSTTAFQSPTSSLTLEPSAETSATMTDLPAATVTPTATATSTLESPTDTATLEPSAEASATSTDLPTAAATATATPTDTATSTATYPTSTPPATITPTSGPTNTPVNPPLSLFASDGASDDRFGRGVALSGNTAVIGAASHNGKRGAVYVFIRIGNSWVPQQKLTASDAAADDLFGWSVAVSGDVAVIGAFMKDSGKGAAYVFTRTGNTWTQQQKLTASDAIAGDNFGISVAINENNAIAVGAYQKANDQGVVYTFVPSGNTWFEFQQLTASDAAVNDWFGYSVAMSGNTITIGAYNKGSGQGAAYVFVWNGGSWDQQQKLSASDADTGDFFGYSVAISGDTTIIGAYGKEGSRGSAYVFTRTGNVWTQQQRLTAGDRVPNDFAGDAVAISGNSAIVGARGKSSGQGAVYLFTRAGNIWTQQQKLMRSDATGDNFGQSIALDGTTAVIGAFLDDFGAHPNQGTAWVYTVP